MVAFRELDERIAFAQQLGATDAPVVLVNVFHVAPGDVDDFIGAWSGDAGFMQQQPGFVSTQLHRGIAGSTTFINVAEWGSVEAFRSAVGSPEFQGNMAKYPESAVASPHLFTKVAVPGICDA